MPPPRRARADGSDFAVPGWLMAPAPAVWASAGAGFLPERGESGGPRVPFARFWAAAGDRTARDGAAELAVPPHAPWLASLLCMAAAAVASAPLYLYVAANDVLARERVGERAAHPSAPPP